MTWTASGKPRPARTSPAAGDPDGPRHIYTAGPRPGMGEGGPHWAGSLAREVALRRRQGLGPSRGFDSLHIGGLDTVPPSPRELTRFLELSRLSPNPGAEVALELHPDEVDERLVDRWVQAGVTRLSFRCPASGVPEGWPDRAGVSRLSSWGVDVPFAIQRKGPDHGFGDSSGAGGAKGGVDGGDAVGSSPANAMQILEAVIHRWAPPQVSLVERVQAGDEGPLEVREPDPDQEDQLADLYLDLTRRLEEAGYRQWSFTAFARPGSEPRHQRAVLEGEAYLGLGPGAHSHARGRRFWNLDDPTAYFIRLESGLDARAGDQRPAPAEQLFHRLWGLLSLEEGLDLRDSGLHDARRIRDRWVSEGWARSAAGRLGLTPAGWLLLDTLIPELAGYWPRGVMPAGAGSNRTPPIRPGT